MVYDRQLSERHQDFWGDECPAVDLDFLMCEFNHGISVAVVDYKHHTADLDKTNSKTYQTLSELYGPNRNQLPFLIARYWTRNWSFVVIAVNEAAKNAVKESSHGRFDGETPVPLSEQEYVRFLYWLRKDALTAGDKRYIDRLNTTKPPSDGERAAA